MSGIQQLTAEAFPGYAQEVARENFLRATACLGLTETVCGIEVLPLNAEHARHLALVRSPFLLRGVTAEQLYDLSGLETHVALCLWIVSPHFRPGQKNRLTTRCRRWADRLTGHLFENQREKFDRVQRPRILQQPAMAALRELIAYFADAFLDAPEPEDGPGKSYYADEVALTLALHHTFALPVDFWERHWLRNCVRRFTGRPSPLQVPYKLVFQLLKAERRFRDPDALLKNPSDALLAAGLSALNARDRRQREYERELLATTFTGTNPPPTVPDLSGKEYEA